jgi:hypothetical protein
MPEREEMDNILSKTKGDKIMTVILIDKDATEPNSKYGYVIEMFDTVEDFKDYIKKELISIKENLKADNMEDAGLDALIRKDLGFWTFNTLFDKYKEYNFEYEFEII